MKVAITTKQYIKQHTLQSTTCLVQTFPRMLGKTIQGIQRKSSSIPSFKCLKIPDWNLFQLKLEKISIYFRCKSCTKKPMEKIFQRLWQDWLQSVYRRTICRIIFSENPITISLVEIFLQLVLTKIQPTQTHADYNHNYGRTKWTFSNFRIVTSFEIDVGIHFGQLGPILTIGILFSSVDAGKW